MVIRSISRGCIFCMLVMCLFSATYSFAQPSKNILRIWFDTITVKTVPNQVVMNCWFKLEGSKPHDFRGFQMPYIYESHQIAPTNYFFSGSACEKAGFHTGSHNSQTGTGSVVVLGSTELDLSKSLLFSIAFIALPRLNDTVFNDFIGQMEVDRERFELSINSGIDSVIITDGWIKYVKELPPEPEKRVSISLLSDSLSIQSDSSGLVSVFTSSLDSARIKRSVFSFSVDTSAVVFDTAIVGSAFQASTSLAVENKLTQVNLFLSSLDTAKQFQGSGELVKLKFTARKREDTVATFLFDSSFFALNADNLLDSVRYQLEKLIVYGVKLDTDTVIKHVSIEDRASSAIRIAPNPANEQVSLSFDSRSALVEIYSLIGERVYSNSMSQLLRIDTRGIASGWYQVLILQAGQRHRALLLIQH